jgi:hypothetical protein
VKIAMLLRALLLLLLAAQVLGGARAQVLEPAQSPVESTREDARLLHETARRAWLFFAEKTDARTGLTHDRARLDGGDDYQIASLAATGYALAALPIAVERKWIKREEALGRARRTLHFVLSMPHQRGWLYHFVGARDGKRAWQSEVSTIDTALFTLGALACGEYFRADKGLARDARRFYERLDWNWARTNGGAQPRKQVLTHGWKPESGFLAYDYGGYSEAIMLVLLGLGAPQNPLPASTWDALDRPIQEFEGLRALKSGPIFIHQMPHGFFPLRGRRDRLGWDYWVSSSQAMRIHRLFCERNASKRETYKRDFWGLNASDGPRGYAAYGAPDGPEDGTVSPTGAMASISFDVDAATGIARRMKAELGSRIWGRYGFANAFNLDEKWFDSDVIGIDLGMYLIAWENHRSGLVWKLMQRQPWLSRAYQKAGLRVTREAEPRVLKK